MSGVDATPDAVRRAVHGVLLPGFTGTTPPRWLLDAARDGLAGVVLFAHNTPDVVTTARLTGRLHDAAPDLLVTVDEEGGDVTRLEADRGSSVPGPAALGAVDDVAEALGRLLAATGVDLDLAPVLDVDAPGNPVIGTRAFGDEARHVARHGTAFVRGLHHGGVGVCAKHFPGHGSTTVDSHVGLPEVTLTLAELRGRDLEPYGAVIGADDDGLPGLDALMTAHVVVPELGPGPASLEPATVTLAREIGFGGPVVTDALDMRAVSDGQHVGRAAVRAVEAGADLLCLGTTADRDDAALFRDAVEALVGAVQDGRISLGALSASAERTAATVSAIRARRLRAGIVPGPQAAQDELAALEVVGRRAARAAVRPAGRAPAPVTTPPAVVDLRRAPHQAVGKRAQHVPDALVRRWPGAVVHAPGADPAVVAEIDTNTDSEEVGTRRPLVVITRELAPGSAEEARLDTLCSRRPDLVVVHTGVRSDVDRWLGRDVDEHSQRHGRPVDSGRSDGRGPAVVLTYGAGRATADAAAHLIAGGTS